MSKHNRQTEMAPRAVVLTIPGMESVAICCDVECEVAADGSHLLDLYAPPGFDPD